MIHTLLSFEIYYYVLWNVVAIDNVTAELFNAYFAYVFTKERELVLDVANLVY